MHLSCGGAVVTQQPAVVWTRKDEMLCSTICGRRARACTPVANAASCSRISSPPSRPWHGGTNQGLRQRLIARTISLPRQADSSAKSGERPQHLPVLVIDGQWFDHSDGLWYPSDDGIDENLPMLVALGYPRIISNDGTSCSGPDTVDVARAPRHREFSHRAAVLLAHTSAVLASPEQLQPSIPYYSRTSATTEDETGLASSSNSSAPSSRFPSPSASDSAPSAASTSDAPPAATDTQSSTTAQGDKPGDTHDPLIAWSVPHPIMILSIVSGTLTLASCIFNTLLPIYMVTELKMSMRSMGVFEGVLEAFSYVVRMFSGIVSDMMVSRKAAITLGFAMGAAAKFGMSGAVEVGPLFISKAVDRLANGIQAAPRDALIGDLSPAAMRSTCFGFAQSMRKWGSMTGALLAFALMRASNNDYRSILLLATATSAVSCLAFMVFVPAHPRPLTPAEQANLAGLSASSSARPDETSGLAPAGVSGGAVPAAEPNSWSRRWHQLVSDVVGMSPAFYRALTIISMYGLGHMSEAMMEARALEVGVAKSSATLIVALLAAVVFVCAYPLGRLDDKYGPRLTFSIGMVALLLGDLLLALSGNSQTAVWVACLCMGVHYAVLQGPLLGTVTRLSPPHLRGTALGIFYTVMALTALMGNSILGHVWSAVGAQAAFMLSAVMVGISMCLLPSLLPERSNQQEQLAVVH